MSMCLSVAALTLRDWYKGGRNTSQQELFSKQFQRWKIRTCQFITCFTSHASRSPTSVLMTHWAVCVHVKYYKSKMILKKGTVNNKWMIYSSVCSIWWYSRLRRTILAKIFASSGAVAAAAAPRRTLGAPKLCMRLAWCMACRPPGIVNCNLKINT